jgi:tRNA nucleotidyltransferase (CCA-adding enzyme)
MIDYPEELKAIFNILTNKGIRAVIVGGYIRDTFLNIHSKDIDIELYNVSTLQDVASLLRPFGKLNEVGKSFGVLKLTYKGLDLDFSLPRIDNKISKGHKGFTIELKKSLSFKEAAQRRDFTMNAIGYDVVSKKILDPFCGQKAIEEKSIIAVDLQKFQEDPLRVLRAVVFASRFHFHIEEKLFAMMQNMVLQNKLKELPKERIFEELKKIFLKSSQPSYAFKLFKKLHLFGKLFNELSCLNENELNQTLKAIDNFASFKEEAKNDEEVLTVMFALLIRFIPNKESFLQKLTNKKSFIKNVLQLTLCKFDTTNIIPYELHKLANNCSIRLFLFYLKAIGTTDTQLHKIEKLAKKLNIYEEAQEPLLKGRDLLQYGLQASPKFQDILQEAYNLQLKEAITTKEKLIELLQRKNLLS